MAHTGNGYGRSSRPSPVDRQDRKSGSRTPAEDDLAFGELAAAREALRSGESVRVLMPVGGRAANPPGGPSSSPSSGYPGVRLSAPSAGSPGPLGGPPAPRPRRLLAICTTLDDVRAAQRGRVPPGAVRLDGKRG